MNLMAFDKILVSDFDGTMTQHVFYSCAVKYVLSVEDLKPWHVYTRQHHEVSERSAPACGAFVSSTS